MECENAYYKDGIRYVLCRKEKEPEAQDRKSAAHAMCGFQRFCPERQCCSLLPGWVGCLKRDCNRVQEAHREETKRKAGSKKGAGKK